MTAAQRVAALPPMVLSEREFGALLEYSRSLPTGTTLGKTWRRCIWRDPWWMVGRYEREAVIDGQEVVEIGWYDPVVIPEGCTIEDMDGWWRGVLPSGETVSARDRQLVASELRRRAR